MKKMVFTGVFLGTLSGLALCTLSGAASADPTVALYGIVDTGFAYQHIDADINGVGSTDTFKMAGGQDYGSRWGLKGVETIGNCKVGYVLENGFDSDTGAVGFSGRIFGRESQLFIQGDFGKIGFGRMSELLSTYGTYALGGATSAFSGGIGDYIGGKQLRIGGWDRFDNGITYQTPTYGGFTGYIQYSFKTDSASAVETGDENKGSVTRFGALGVKYDNGGTEAVLIGNWYQWGSDTTDLSNGYLVTLGINHDFGKVKPFFSAQVFDNLRSTGTTLRGRIAGAYDDFDGDNGRVRGIKGWSVGLGVSAPLAGGVFKLEAGYRYAESVDESSVEYRRCGFAIGYDYHISKRTMLYAYGGYNKDKYEYPDQDDTKPSVVELSCGMVHWF